MGYPNTWEGEVNRPEGTATFVVEGETYTLRLHCFADNRAIAKMLDAAFASGQQFAEQAIRSHVERALDDAKRSHAL